MAYFTTLYSGSSGNCALIRSEDKYLLIDMGKSCRTTLTALKSLGLAVSDCVGILVTHEHSDHVSGLDTFLKKHPVPLYGCADTLDTLASRGTIPPAVEAIPVDGQTLEIGSFTVTSFPTSHDVPCCGYRIRTPEGRVMAFATDLGYLTPVVQDNLMGCDLVALEANYDAFSLHGGPYPYYLKVRIASDRGHLDNKACAALAMTFLTEPKPARTGVSPEAAGQTDPDRLQEVSSKVLIVSSTLDPAAQRISYTVQLTEEPEDWIAQKQWYGVASYADVEIFYPEAGSYYRQTDVPHLRFYEWGLADQPTDLESQRPDTGTRYNDYIVDSVTVLSVDGVQHSTFRRVGQSLLLEEDTHYSGGSVSFHAWLQ